MRIDNQQTQDSIKTGFKRLEDKARQFSRDYPLTFALVGSGASLVGSMVVNRFFAGHKSKSTRKKPASKSRVAKK